MTEQPCWYNRFHPTAVPCPHPGTWRSSSELVAESPSPAFIEAVRGCDLHRHAGDVSEVPR